MILTSDDVGVKCVANQSLLGCCVWLHGTHHSRGDFFMINSKDLKDTFRLVRPWKYNYKDDEWTRGWNECIKQLRKNENKLIRTIKSIEEEWDKLESQNNDL